jgi:hypothetical protein
MPQIINQLPPSSPLRATSVLYIFARGKSPETCSRVRCCLPLSCDQDAATANQASTLARSASPLFMKWPGAELQVCACACTCVRALDV